jgi:ubiquinone/menaquinone biosynthesis C-methylase UbiE
VNSYYLSFQDLVDFVKAVRSRTKSFQAYKEFEEFQGYLLLKYLASEGISTHDFRILDMANGFGGQTNELSRESRYVVGLDLNYPPIKPSTDQILADALHSPFGANSFDLILSASLIEHISKPMLLLEELYRILKPDGYIYLSFPPFYSITGGHSYAPFHYLGEKTAVLLSKIRKRVFKKKIFGKVESLGESYSSAYDNWGLYRITIKEAKRLIRSSGFMVIDQSTKWLPFNFSNIPLIGEVLTWHVQFLLKKRT